MAPFSDMSVTARLCCGCVDEGIRWSESTPLLIHYHGWLTCRVDKIAGVQSSFKKTFLIFFFFIKVCESLTSTILRVSLRRIIRNMDRWTRAEPQIYSWLHCGENETLCFQFHQLQCVRTNGGCIFEADNRMNSVFFASFKSLQVIWRI